MNGYWSSARRLRRKPHIFLSFKSEERALAAALRTALLHSGYAVWWQEDIQCGKEWHGDIDAAILHAGCVVVLWSTASIRSQWVRHEASQAIARGVYTPVRTESVEVESPFDRIQATDLRNWKSEPDHPGLLSLLSRVEELTPINLTTTGRAALFLRHQALPLLGILALLATTTVIIQLYFSLRDVTHAQSEIVSAVQQSLMPVDTVSARLTLRMDKGIKGIEAYESLLRKNLQIDETGVIRNSSAALPSGVFPVTWRAEGIDSIAIVPTSPLWPKDIDGTYVGTLASVPNVNVLLCWQPAPSLSQQPVEGIDCGSESTQPNLSLRVSPNDFERTYWDSDDRLIWQPVSGKLTLTVVRQFTKRSNSWKANGRFATVPELENASLSVQILGDGLQLGDFLRSLSPAERRALEFGDKPTEKQRVAVREMAAEVQRARQGLRFEALQLVYSGRTLIIGASDTRSEIGVSGLQICRADLRTLRNTR